MVRVQAYAHTLTPHAKHAAPAAPGRHVLCHSTACTRGPTRTSGTLAEPARETRERPERVNTKSPKKTVHAGHAAPHGTTRGHCTAPPPHARPREPHSTRGAPPASDMRQHAKVSRDGRATALFRAGGVAVPPGLPAAPPAPQQHEQDGGFDGRACCWPAPRGGGGRLLTATRTCQWRAKKGVNVHSRSAGGGGRRVALE